MVRRFEVIPRLGLAYRPPLSLWDRFLEDWDFPETFAGEREWTPASDVSETDSHYHVSMELPGIDMKEMDIFFADGVLSIKGEKAKATDIEESCFCSERYSGHFERTFRIPGGVDKDGIHATYRDGILKISLPKSEASSVRKIEIH